jgi:glycosyltransferase involved in cell wall biosynthesis
MIKFPVKEVIIVDNNSTEPISQQEFMQAFIKEPLRIVVEKKQGLTPARLRGIREATSEILVFIDDDNFITEDFFTQGMEIADKNPHIGAFSGQVKLVFEMEPPAWTRKYWGLLVYREFDKDLWSNLPHLNDTIPSGAGLFVRREVADHYFKLHETGKRKIQLDRSGKSLFSGGDNDLAACACDIGLGVGLFHKLILKHYIPKERLSLEYLLQLTYGINASAVVLKSYRNQFPIPLSFKSGVANFFRKIYMNRLERKFFVASLEGEKEGRSMLFKNSILKDHA